MLKLSVKYFKILSSCHWGLKIRKKNLFISISSQTCLIRFRNDWMNEEETSLRSNNSYYTVVFSHTINQRCVLYIKPNSKVNFSHPCKLHIQSLSRSLKKLSFIINIYHPHHIIVCSNMSCYTKWTTRKMGLGG